MSPRKRDKKPGAPTLVEAPEPDEANEDAPSAAADDRDAVAADAEASSEAQSAAAPDAAAEHAPDDAAPVDAPRTREQLKRVIESLVFVSDQVITAQQIARIVKSKQQEVRELLSEITADYMGRGIELVEVASGFQFRSAMASAPFVRDLVSARPVRLTRAQLETLALVAYRQPITRPEIDDVRGVDSGSALKVLLERGLLKILGRKDEAGRPLLYGTTPYFLEFFGMKGMQDLPTLREFTELSDENRELFKRKTNEIGDLSTEAAPTVIASSTEIEEESFNDEELFAIAEAAKAEAQDGEAAPTASIPAAESEPVPENSQETAESEREAES